MDPTKVDLNAADLKIPDGEIIVTAEQLRKIVESAGRVGDLETQLQTATTRLDNAMNYAQAGIDLVTDGLEADKYRSSAKALLQLKGMPEDKIDGYLDSYFKAPDDDGNQNSNDQGQKKKPAPKKEEPTMDPHLAAQLKAFQADLDSTKQGLTAQRIKLAQKALVEGTNRFIAEDPYLKGLAKSYGDRYSDPEKLSSHQASVRAQIASNAKSLVEAEIRKGTPLDAINYDSIVQQAGKSTVSAITSLIGDAGLGTTPDAVVDDSFTEALRELGDAKSKAPSVDDFRDADHTKMDALNHNHEDAMAQGLLEDIMSAPSGESVI